MFAFLFTPLGKIVSIVVIVSVLGLSIWTSLKLRDASVRREALLEFNKKQLEVVIQEQEEQKKRWQNLEENVLPKLFESISKELEKTQKNVDDAEAYLRSDDARNKDREASVIIKETLRRLGAPK